MVKTGKSIRLLALAVAVSTLFLLFFLFVRPWYLRWGATEEEARRSLPGDEIVPNAAGQETRAITIHAGSERVWPWVAQLGQDRGGFYSFDLLENLVGCEMPTDDRLHPHRQRWKPGDKLWMYPPDKGGGVGFATLHTYRPGRALGFGSHSMGTLLNEGEDGSWSFVLAPIDATTTRLLIRGRGATGRSLLGTAFDRSVFEPVHFVMERRMMIGINQLAEGADRRRLLNHIHMAFFTLSLVGMVIAVWAVMRRKVWVRALAAFVAASVVFQILTLVQPPLPLGLGLIVAEGLLLWWPDSPEPGDSPRSGRKGKVTTEPDRYGEAVIL